LEDIAMGDDLRIAFAMNSFGLTLACFGLFYTTWVNGDLLIAGIFGICMEIFIFLTAFYLLVAPIIERRKLKSR